MCGRFTLTRSAAEIAEHFGLDLGLGLDEPDAGEPGAALTPRFNIAPTQAVAAIREGGDGQRVLEFRHWGLVPHWASDASGAARMINARAETAAEKPAFRDALQRRRCLVPADGFYEWRKQGREPARPHHIALPDQALFAFAGLYERWTGGDGEPLDSVTLLTRTALPNLRGLHHRMPVLVDPGGYAAWLDRGETDGVRALAALGPARGGELVPRPVDPRVNDVRHDDAACLDDERQLSLLGDGF